MASLRPPARSLHATLLRPRSVGAPKLAARPLGAASVRHKSGPYGYTQAKALVFTRPGEPADVLSYGLLPLFPSRAKQAEKLTIFPPYYP